MIPFHSTLPELAQQEVRCVHVGHSPDTDVEATLPADEYAFLEFYCPDAKCDCRQVFFQVIAKNQPGRIFASINYGWEKESFYRKRFTWDPDAARKIVREHLDPLNEQSEFAEEFLELFRRFVLDEPYRLRLRRHYRLFREAVARDGNPPNAGARTTNKPTD